MSTGHAAVSSIKFCRAMSANELPDDISRQSAGVQRLFVECEERIDTPLGRTN